MNIEDPALAPFFRHDFDRERRRIHMRYTGFWNADVARDVLNAFRAALRSASADARPLTLLDDCRDWQPQSQEVNEIAKRFVEICRDFKIRRNAMIIPSVLVQMQVRRTLSDFDACEIFGTYEEADRWLAEVEPGAQE